MLTGMSNLLNRLFRRKSAAASAMVMHRQGQPAPRLTNIKALSTDGYAKNPDVFAAVNGITGNAKGIEWKLLKLSNRAARKGITPQQVRSTLHTAAKLGGKHGYMKKQRQLIKERVLVPIDTHALLDLLAQPNPLQDWSEFIESVLGHYCVTGNYFVNAVGPTDSTKPPQELWVLRPDKMKVIVGNQEQPVLGYKYGDGEGQTLPFESVLHGKTWNPLDDYWGMSPIMAAARRVDWSNAAEDWNLALVQSGGQPGGAVVVEGRLTPDQRSEMKEWVDEEYLGTKNVGRPLLLEGGMDWKTLSLTPQEAAWLDGQEHATRKIAHVLGWPSVLLGDSSDRTYSNYGEARKASYEEATLPKLDMLRNKLNTWLVPRFGPDLLLAYDTDDIEALQEDRDKLWNRIGAAEHLTINEKRLATGYAEHPGADVLLVPAMKIPVGGSKESTGKQDANPLLGKAIGLKTMEQKTAWWEAMQAQRERLTEAMEPLALDVLDAERDAVVKAIKSTGSPASAAIAAEKALSAHRSDWEDLVKRIYTVVGSAFASDVAANLSKQTSLPYGVTKDEVEDTWRNTILEYLATITETKSKIITETSMGQIRQALATGIADGESIPKLAARVGEVYDAGNPYRSKMIARTETIAASNLGSRAGAKATELPLLKEWLTTPGPRTRDSHRQAGAAYSIKPIEMDEAYVVGGSQLLFPGDSSLGAAASEVVNCRCTEVYQVAE